MSTADRNPKAPKAWIEKIEHHYRTEMTLLPAETREAAYRLVQYARQHRPADPEVHLEELTNYSPGTWYQVCTGRYGVGEHPGNLGRFTRALKKALKRIAESSNAGFVDTWVTKEIESICDYALAGNLRGGLMGLVIGGTGRSKTEAALHWARNQDSRVVYLDCPVGGGLGGFRNALAKACGISARLSWGEVDARLYRHFDSSTMLILDEVGRLMPTGKSNNVQILEWIRRLYDDRRCPIVCLATDVFAHALKAGRMQDFLEQLLGRFGEFLRVPHKADDDELAAIIRAHLDRNRKATPELMELARTIADGPGALRPVFELLGQANKLAVAKKVPLDHTHLEAALERRKRRLRGAKPKRRKGGAS